MHTGSAWDGTARAAVAIAEALGPSVAFLAALDGSEIARRAEIAGIAVRRMPDGAAVKARAAALSGSAPEGWLATSDDALHLSAVVARRAGRGGLVRRVAVGERDLAANSRWFRTAPMAAYVFASRTDAERASLPPSAVRAGVLEPWGRPADVRSAAAPRHVGMITAGDSAAAHVALRGAAALLLAQRDVRLVLLGQGCRDDTLRVHAGALGIAERVVAGGDFDEARWLASAAAVWVVAEGDDGAFGALAAASHGVPVLTVRGSAAARALGSAGSADPVPAEEPLVGASVLAHWLGDEPRRRAQGLALRERLGVHAPAAVSDVLAHALHAVRGPRAGVA
jgi:hypothetical protein